ncbi:hypothetical protein NKG05_02330 [Oerskovia sp. M15]
MRGLLLPDSRARLGTAPRLVGCPRPSPTPASRASVPTSCPSSAAAAASTPGSSALGRARRGVRRGRPARGGPHLGGPGIRARRRSDLRARGSLVVEVGSGLGSAWSRPPRPGPSAASGRRGLPARSGADRPARRPARPDEPAPAAGERRGGADDRAARGSVDELWIFFPDPWHKARHHKRRLVTSELVELAARAIRPGGTWRLATDWAEYADRMLEVIGASPAFENVHGQEPSRPLRGRVLTSFEGKGHAAGRAITDLEFRRV